ncbi:MAG: phosphate-starvation-inducible PsiE family protein, partial [Deltaproteobacteria bacterium]|nr:phosphate-starvation-inducible PsiE family protein [Deltaproteobacteria bacterium]
AFMAVLIAIEIFVNICVYLREDVIHVQIVMATALMAIARKVIILDFEEIDSEYVWAIAGVVLAMSIGYYLVLNSSAGLKNSFDRIFLKKKTLKTDDDKKKT